MTTTMATMVSAKDNMTTDAPVDPTLEALTLAARWVNVVILVVIMLAMGCTIDLHDIRLTFRRPTAFFVGMFCQFVAMPLLSFTLGVAFDLEAAPALSILVLGCCPGGTLSNIFTFWTNGDTCLSVSMTTVSTAVAIGMMPLNLFIYSRRWTSEQTVIPYLDIFTTLVTMLIPVIVGIFLRWWKEQWMKLFTRVGIAVACLSIVAVFTINQYLNPTYLSAPWQLWLCAATLPVFGFSLGSGIALLLRQSHVKCRTIAFETGSQNVSLAYTLTLITFFNSPLFFDMLFYPTLYAVFIYIDSFVIIGVFKLIVFLRNRGKPPSAGEDEAGGNLHRTGLDNPVSVNDDVETNPE